MKNSVLCYSVLAAWIMALAYDRIQMTTGVEIDMLLGGAIVTMVAGLYFGLYTKPNKTSKEEALAE